MEIDELINEELLALSDCSSDNEDYDSDFENNEVDVVAIPQDVDYLQLFLQKSNLQFEKTDRVLCAAEDILKEESNNDDFDKKVIEKYLYENDNENSEEISDDGIDNKSIRESEFDVEGLEKRLQNLTSSFVKQKLESEKKIQEFDVVSKQENDQTLLDLETERQKAQENLKLMEHEEKRILLKLEQEKLFYEQQRKNNAACCIQCYYRGYIARREFGCILKEMIKESKRKRVEERIALIEKEKEIERKNITQTSTEKILNEEMPTNLQEENSDSNETENQGSDKNLFITEENAPISENIFSEIESLEISQASKDSDFDDERRQIDKNLKNDAVFKELSEPDNKTNANLKFAEEFIQNDIVNDLKNDGAIKDILELDTLPDKDSDFHDEHKQSDIDDELKRDIALKEISEPDNKTDADLQLTEEFLQNDTDNDLKEMSELDNLTDASSVNNITDAITHEEKPNQREEYNLKSDLKILPDIESLHIERASTFVKETPDIIHNDVNTDRYKEDMLSNSNKAEYFTNSNLRVNNNTEEINSEDVVKSEKQTKDLDCDVSYELSKTIRKEDTYIVASDVIDSYPVNNLASKFHDNETENQQNKTGYLKDTEIEGQNTVTNYVQSNKNCDITTTKIETSTHLFSEQTSDNSVLFNNIMNQSVTKTEINSESHSVDFNLNKLDAKEKFDICDHSEIISDDLFCSVDKKHDIGITKENLEEIKGEIIRENATFVMENNIKEDASVCYTSNIDTEEFVTTEEVKQPPNEIKNTEMTEQVFSIEEKSKYEAKPPNIDRQTRCSLDPRMDNFESESYGENGSENIGSNIIIEDESLKGSQNKEKIQNPIQDSKENNKMEDFENSCDKKEIESDSLETLLTKWRRECCKWTMKECNKSAGLLRREIRKSSAAKKLQPISEDEIINGKWPTCREKVNERTLTNLSKVYISNLNSKGSNLLVVQQCSHLTHLTLFKCGLISLEGLQACPSLRHINASTNKISVVSCNGMKRLESFVACDNLLTSIHGLSGCHSLVYLDLSFNSITRVGGLDDLNTLLQLRLNNNQLIDLSGLSSVNSLLSLDVSNNHLTSLNGIQQCGLLRSIQACGNYLKSLSQNEFENLVLLRYLDLSKNNLTTFPPSNLWLPCLTSANVQCNKITLEDNSLNLSVSFPSLSLLDLSQNLIAQTKSFLSGLEVYVGPQMKLRLWENLLTNDQETDLMDFSATKNFSFEFSENEHLKPKNIDLVLNAILGQSFNGDSQHLNMSKNSEFLKFVLHDLKESNNVLFPARKVVRNMSGWLPHYSVENGKLFNYFDLPADLVSFHCETLQKQLKIALKLRKWFESSNYIYFTDVKQPSFNKYGSIQQEVQSNNPAFNISKNNQSLITQQRNKAATLIQTHYKGFRCRKLFQELLEKRLFAATIIQANWKSYCARKTKKQEPESYNFQPSNKIDISKTLNNVNENSYNKSGNPFTVNRSGSANNFDEDDDFDDDFNEIDLSEFNFNDDDFEKQWAYKTDVARQIMMSSRSGSNQNFFSANDVNAETDIPKLDTFSKTPLPPITPSSTRSTPRNSHRHPISRTITPSSDYPLQESHRSKHSIKEERLANEWGLKNSETAELMLRRARKMKGRQRKEINAEVKLKRFQEMSQKVTSQPLPTAQRSKLSAQKMEYFKAREQAFEKKDNEPSEDDERRRQYTYEWLHTSANLTPENPVEHFGTRNHRLLKKRGFSQDSISVKSGFLPHIPKQRSLVQSPANTMEVMSISSYGSKRNRELLKDIVKRHGDNNEV